MKCPRCQTENPATSKYCPRCGAKLILVCPQCSSERPLEDRFCALCGHDLDEPEAVSRIDYSHPDSYTPKPLADKIVSSRSLIEGERKLVTVLFADVARYSFITEKLDAEEVHQIMNGCFKILMDEIHRYEGTIDKFIGDGIMALFGAPLAHEDHAQRACYAALSITKAINEYGEKIEEKTGVEFKMRVGLNSGHVMVGTIGNDLRMEYTDIGNTINIAYRTERTAKPGTILVSANSYRLTKDFFKFTPLGHVEIKGKQEPQEAYELLEASKVETRIEAAVVRGLARFVGRDNEITTLIEAFNTAAAGSGQIVGIVGEAGVGKSRTLLELRGRLPEDEYTYIEGRCLHYGSSMPYLPFLDIIRSYFDIKEGDPEFHIKTNILKKITALDEQILNILAPLHDFLSLDIEDDEYRKLEPPQRRTRIFEALRDLFIRESQERPLILAIEDLHWIDRTSEEFLAYLIGWLTNPRILLLLLYRTEYRHPWGGKSYYGQISVDQLSTASSIELVQSILEEGEVTSELNRLILSKAGGNPLFVEEFTHALIENGSIQKNDGQYVLTAGSSDIQIPDTIQGIIAARLDRLEDNIKRTMQVASAIGRDFAFRVLQIVTGMQDQLKTYLLNLQELEFIYEKSLFPELEYIFKHVLTQEVAYNSMLLSRKKKLHERIGNAIELLYPERLEEFYEILAHHHSRGENLEKSYRYFRLSGEKAARNSSNWEALRFCKEAIDVLSLFPKTKTNKQRGMEVRLIMSGPMRLVAYPEGSLEILQEGARLAEALKDTATQAKFSSLIGAYHAFRGDPVLGMKYCENTFEIAQKIEDIDLVAPSALDLCHSCFISGEYSKEIEIAPKAVALLEKTKRQVEFFNRPLNVYSALLVHHGHALGTIGDFKQGQALCEKGLGFAREINNPYSIGFVALVYGMFLGHKGDGENAIQQFQDACRYLEETQAIIVLGLAWTGLGWGYLLLGDPETALKHTEKGLQIQRDTGIPFFLSLHHWRLGETHLALGNLDNARTNADEAIKLARKNNEKWSEGISKILLGTILGKIAVSQSNDVEQHFLEGIDILNNLELKPYVSRGYLYMGEYFIEMGRKEKGLEFIKKAETMYREMGMTYWLRRTQEILDGVKM